MKIAVAAFTENGGKIAEILKKEIGAEGYLFKKYELDGLKPFESLSELMREIFDKYEAIIFIGACGIAVRAIAPYIKSKVFDPAVVVVDERAEFAVPILSGHIGGANELALKIAEITGAKPVITTATDTNGKFSVDVFAVKNNLHIADMRMAKLISAELLQGHKIGLYSEFKLENVPDCFCENAEIGICISHDGEKKPFLETLNLIPKNVVLGAGCKKGTSDMIMLAGEFLAAHGISREAVCMIASIDLKKDEKAMNRLADELGVPFRTYTARELSEQIGEFTSSEFVKETVGVDNVCERAVCASGAELAVKKTAKNGVTLAAGTISLKIDFGRGYQRRKQ